MDPVIVIILLIIPWGFSLRSAYCYGRADGYRKIRKELESMPKYKLKVDDS